MQHPRLLIDGYNVMFESIGAPDVRNGVQALRIARARLLDYIASRLEFEVRKSTLIVFDSADATGLPTELTYSSMQLIFAKDDASADDFLIRTIRRHPHPKSLTVISSDHRIQNAASARNAVFFDSEDWISEILPTDPIVVTTSPITKLSDQTETDKPEAPMTEAERNRWLQEFGLPSTEPDTSEPEG